jgi:hypothetical protein
MRVEWCDGRNCTAVDFLTTAQDPPVMEDNQRFLTAFMTHEEAVREKTTLLRMINDVLEKLGTVLNPSNDVSVESQTPVTDEMKGAYLHYLTENQEGAFQALAAPRLREILQELNAIKKSLQL